MRDFKGMKRQRGRNNRGGAGSGGKPQQHNANRAFDSNGPEGVKVRGAAQSVYEKYQQLARDATSSGDRVLAENYLQHAEHYFRVLRAIQPNRPVSDIIGKDAYSAYEIDFEAEPEEQPETPEATQAEAPAEGEGGEGQGEAAPRSFREPSPRGSSPRRPARRPPPRQQSEPRPFRRSARSGPGSGPPRPLARPRRPSRATASVTIVPGMIAPGMIAPVTTVLATTAPGKIVPVTTGPVTTVRAKTASATSVPATTARPPPKAPKRRLAKGAKAAASVRVVTAPRVTAIRWR
jgi:hypothetical protein